MTLPRLLGIHAAAYAGKTTLAEAFGRHGYHIKSFAAPVKAMVKAYLLLLGVSEADIAFYQTNKDAEIPPLGMSIRQCWQTLGTDWGRNTIYPDCWVLAAQSAIAIHQERFNATPSAGIIFDDVRFDNEADFIRRQGGVIIHLKTERELAAYDHESERGIEFREGDVEYVQGAPLEELVGLIAESKQDDR